MKEKKVLKEIDRIKDLIKSPLNEVSLMQLNKTDYSNLKYDKDGTHTDSVNQALLDDINAAAKKAGLVATITTAKTGHSTYTKGNKNISRHMNGTGVDVAILDGLGSGGATNSTNGNATFRNLGFKLKDALVSIGYTWNKEVGEPKAVLWHTNIGGNHYNHLHISNNTDKPSSGVEFSDSKTSGSPISSSSSFSFFDLLNKISKGDTDSLKNELINIFTGALKEQYSIGKKSRMDDGELIIPASSNPKIYSTVRGQVVDFKFLMGCKNKIAIQHYDKNQEVLFLVFCGLEKPYLKNGDGVMVGTPIGELKGDVTVTLYNSRGSKLDIENYQSTAKTKPQKKSERYKSFLPTYKDDKDRNVSFLPNYKDDKQRNMSFLPTYKEKNVSFLPNYKEKNISFLPTYKESLSDDIEKIKKLLK
jgi:hypothetical protein